jgi:hypothetical protein
MDQLCRFLHGISGTTNIQNWAIPPMPNRSYTHRVAGLP